MHRRPDNADSIFSRRRDLRDNPCSVCRPELMMVTTFTPPLCWFDNTMGSVTSSCVAWCQAPRLGSGRRMIRPAHLSTPRQTALLSRADGYLSGIKCQQRPSCVNWPSGRFQSTAVVRLAAFRNHRTEAPGRVQHDDWCPVGQIDQSARRRMIRAKRLRTHARTGRLVNQRWSAQFAHDGQSDPHRNRAGLCF